MLIQNVKNNQQQILIKI